MPGPRRSDPGAPRPARDASAGPGAPAEADALAEYRARRDFDRTPEPPAPGGGPPAERAAPGDDAAAAGAARPGGPLVFVVQKHDATRLHYDVRLEIDGALHSWPVPKGPSLDPAERRLAVMTEPHPLGYGAFEGVIPAGEYGAGEVIVWDHGTYSPDAYGEAPPRGRQAAAPGPGAQYDFDDPVRASERMRAQVERGKISVTLRGARMRGSFTFVRTGGSGGDRAAGDASWLLIKHRDAAAQAGVDLAREYDASVRSGLTIADLQAGRVPTPLAELVPAALGELRGAVAAPFPERLTPMQAQLASGPFDAPDWWFEPKADGIRVLAHVQRGRVTLRSRRGTDLTATYPGIARAFAAQPVSSAVFDAEIVAFGPDGAPAFAALEQRMSLHDAEAVRRAEAAVPVACLVFDLPYLDGYDLQPAPWWQRREVLRRVLLPGDPLHLVEGFAGTGEAAFDAALALGFEGVVAKHRDAPYRAGTRSARWLKVKARRTGDFVVGGFTSGQGGRAATFGALLLGRPGEDGLRFVGAVGGGFDDATLARLRQRLEATAGAASPFGALPPDSPAAQPGVTYVTPELVVEVAYAEWTPGGHLRAPVFLRVRDDQSPADVTDEEPVPVPGAAAAGAAPGTGRSGAPVARTARPVPRSAAPRPAAPGAAAGPGAAPAPGAAGPGAGPRVDPAEVAAVLDQLAGAGADVELAVAGERVAVGSLDKVLWPEVPGQRALTKRDLLAYYARVAPVLLPHIRDRPLTLTRYPDGITGGSFYQKHADYAPEFVERVPVHSESKGGAQEFLLCNNLPTLLWLGQIADLAIHTSLARVRPGPDAPEAGTDFRSSRAALEASVLNRPDVLLFDLDPYIYAGDEAAGAEPELNRRGWRATCDAARWLRELLGTAGLSAYLKTSGATGLHIYVPIARNLTYPEVRSLAETFAGFLLRAHPRELTTEWSVDRRTGRVFVDVNQNARIKNLAAPYSPRTKPGAPVSTPLRWSELDRVYPPDFTMLTVPQRIEDLGDLWESIHAAQQDVTALLAAE